MALLDFNLVISGSISSAVVGEMKKLLQKEVFKYSKGDISTFGIEQARSLPILAKKLLNISYDDQLRHYYL